MPHLLSLVVILLLLASCRPQPTPTALSPSKTTAAPSQASQAQLQPSAATAVPPLTPTPSTTATATAQATPEPAPQVCSPLDGFSLSELPDTISNPFHPPRLGSDDPHQGVDFADRQGLDQIALPGRTVRAVLGGQVAGVVSGRFPYGNAVIVETGLEDLPAGMAGQLDLPPPLVETPLPSALTCPPVQDSDWEPQERSLYLLYAHMQAAPRVVPGEEVACGQDLGQVGDSGNALNPHLHLEARAGPSGWRFNSMAHYDASALQEEMGAYCLWRVSGHFLVIDPLRLLSPAP